MTLRHWDAPCRVVSVITEPDFETNTTCIRTIIELLECYGDGSGRAGQKLSINPNQLNADGGWEEISNAILSQVKQSNIKDKIMTAVEKSYEGKSIRELTEMFNSMVPKNKQVKTFRNRETAIKRMTEAFKDPVGNHDPKEKVPAKLAQAATVVAQQFKLVGRKSNNAGKKIFKISKENPRRAGSLGAQNWEIYRDGMTYEEFIMAKGGANHLSYDLEKGYVELK